MRKVAPRPTRANHGGLAPPPNPDAALKSVLDFARHADPLVVDVAEAELQLIRDDIRNRRREQLRLLERILLVPTHLFALLVALSLRHINDAVVAPPTDHACKKIE